MKIAALVCGLLCCLSGVVGLFPPTLAPQKTTGPVRTIVDPSGKRMNIALPFRGAAFFAPFLPGYLYATQRPSSIAAMSASDFTYISYSRALLSKIFPGLNRIDTSISRKFAPANNLERMLQIRPGAIFAFSASYAQPLSKLGLPVVSFPLRPKLLESAVFHEAETYQHVLGMNDRAEQLWSNYHDEFASLHHDLAGRLPTGLQPKVMLIIFEQPDRSFWIAATSDLYAAFVERAGGRNPEGKGRLTVNLEQMIRVDPDVILLLPLAHLTPNDFYARPVFASLQAVRNRRVYRVPIGLQDSFFNNIIESPLFSRWLAELLHPDVMPREIRQRMRNAYKTDFGYCVSDDELDQLLVLNENSRSAGYERFRK